MFLVREDDGMLLRADEIAEDGKHEDFVGWDNVTGAPLQMAFRREPLLCRRRSGRAVERPLRDGSEERGTPWPCRTALEVLAERMKPYTISRATEVTGVPENKIVDAVHTYATNGPAYICWGVGGGDQHGYNATNSGLGKTILRILTGNIDNYGGEYLGDPGLLNEEGIKDFAVRDAELAPSEVVTPETRAKFLGNDEYRLMTLEGVRAHRRMLPQDVGHPPSHAASDGRDAAQSTGTRSSTKTRIP